MIGLSNVMKAKRQAADEDYELVSQCKRGDVDAFEMLVKKHEQRMFNIAYRMLGNYDDACEIVQDAFISAYRGIKHFRGMAKFSTWLSTIVINLSRNRLKQLKTVRSHEQLSLSNPVAAGGEEMQPELASSEHSALETVEQRDIQEKVQECINALDAEFKEVLVLRDIQGFSYDEISEMLKVPGGTVKSRLFRARAAVKDCLKSLLGDL